jgi:hypothetical protein
MVPSCQWIVRTAQGVRVRCGALTVGGDYCALHRFGDPHRPRIPRAKASLNRDVLPWAGPDEAVFERQTRSKEPR